MSRHGPPGEPPGPHPAPGEYGPPTDPWGSGGYPPGRYDRGGYGPGEGPGGYGPGEYGPGEYDPEGYGPAGSGPDNYGREGYPPESYPPGGYGPGGYGPGGYDSGGYGPGGYDPGGYPAGYDPGYGGGGYEPGYGPEGAGGPGGYPPEPYDGPPPEDDEPRPPRYDDPPPRRPIGLYVVVAALVLFAAIGVGYALFLLTGSDDPGAGPAAGPTGPASPGSTLDPNATFDNIGMNAAMARVDDCLVNDGNAAEPALRIVACDAVEEAGQLFQVLEIVDERVEGVGEEANEQAQELCLGAEGYTHHYYEVGETTNFVLCMSEHDPAGPSDADEGDDADDADDQGGEDDAGASDPGGDGY